VKFAPAKVRARVETASASDSTNIQKELSSPTLSDDKSAHQGIKTTRKIKKVKLTSTDGSQESISRAKVGSQEKKGSAEMKSSNGREKPKKKTSLQMETVTPWGVVLKPVIREVKKPRKSRIEEVVVDPDGLRLPELNAEGVQLEEYQGKTETPDVETRKDSEKADETSASPLLPTRICTPEVVVEPPARPLPQRPALGGAKVSPSDDDGRGESTKTWKTNAVNIPNNPHADPSPTTRTRTSTHKRETPTPARDSEKAAAFLRAKSLRIRVLSESSSRDLPPMLSPPAPDGSVRSLPATLGRKRCRRMMSRSQSLAPEATERLSASFPSLATLSPPSAAETRMALRRIRRTQGPDERAALLSSFRHILRRKRTVSEFGTSSSAAQCVLR